jgi:hypothetical protein
MITYNKLRQNIAVDFQDTKTRTYGVISFTLVTVLILAIFAIKPVFDALSSEIGEVSSLQGEDQQLKTNITNLGIAESRFDSDVVGNTSTLSTALPTSQETGPLFANMNAIAKTYNTQITSISFVPPTDPSVVNSTAKPAIKVPGTTELYFVASGQAKFSDLENFVSALEQYPRTFTIVTLDVNVPQSTTGATSSPEFNMVGYVYYL